MSVRRFQEHPAWPAVQTQLADACMKPLFVFLRGGLRALLCDGLAFTLPVKCGMIQLLGAVEDALGVTRTLPSRAKRRAERVE